MNKSISIEDILNKSSQLIMTKIIRKEVLC